VPKKNKYRLLGENEIKAGGCKRKEEGRKEEDAIYTRQHFRDSSAMATPAATENSRNAR